MLIVLGLVVAGVVLLGGPVARSVDGGPVARSIPPIRQLPTSRLAAVGAVAVAAVGASLSSPLVAGPGAVLVVIAGRIVDPLRQRRRLRTRRTAMTALVDGLNRSVRSGATLPTALDEVRNDGVAPALEAELRHIRAELDAGRSFPIVVDEWSRRTDDPDLRLLAGTVAVLAVTGGSAGPALDAAARTIRARSSAEAEVRALASQALASAAVLVSAPFLFAAVLAAVDARLAAFLLQHPAGALCVSAGLALDGLGLWWMQRIIDGGTR